MFTQKDYDLDREYRQRQMHRAEHAQQIRDLRQDDSAPRSVPVTVVSLLLIVISLAALVAYFTWSASLLVV